jgi:putative transcriptional regulator
MVKSKQEAIMTTAKRNLFEELSEGFEALEAERLNKLTLRRHTVESRPVEALSSIELISARKQLKMSQGVFAQYLRISVKTLQNWEQGRGKPNDQAALLIRLVAKYPDTLERLEHVR